MSDDDLVPDELRLIPVSNTADGAFTGVQAGVIHGGVRLGVDRTPRLVALRATHAELDDVRRYFERPGGYTTARRLLVDVGAEEVVEANRERPLGAFDDLAAGSTAVAAAPHRGGLKALLPWVARVLRLHGVSARDPLVRDLDLAEVEVPLTDEHDPGRWCRPRHQRAHRTRR
ncbi:hypothetical protein [Saccharothrix algeriensis]|uniref:Uncharacterized protein n=1 Tax=Saccharothrix algeriensis TaxID=173560 RepID=A0ABS2S3R7_9PSEU|nr:hypothetical protein [Saccharothrix algeriensis]MBM7810329.1 hypothetical protein [Saccharothrix algeriensis]